MILRLTKSFVSLENAIVMHYFDHNATTPVAEVAQRAWIQAVRESWENPSSPYRVAARVKNLLEDKRERLANLLGCAKAQIVFNSGATEGNNSLINFFHGRSNSHSRVVISAIEHPCVIEAAESAFAGRVDYLPVSEDCVVDIETLRKYLDEGEVALVSVMAANNETGVLQPWKEIGRICGESGVPYHCDASQWLGKLPAGELGECSYVTGCGHKFNGPKGIGFAKIEKEDNDFKSLLGGEQESGHRGGTENYPAIAAMIAALEEATGVIYSAKEEQLPYRKEFEETLSRQLEGAEIVAGKAERLWNTVSIILPEHENIRWVRKLDKLGFAVSTGSACATGKEGPSHVLAAMGVSREKIRRVVRISGGWSTPRDAWRSLAEAFVRVWRDFKTTSTADDRTYVISI